MEAWREFWAAAVAIAWGLPLVVLLIGAGVYFSMVGRFVPLRHLRHAIDIARGRYDDPDDPGEISHFQALTAALSGTVGVGNLGGVAIAVSLGGPGAVFWMWIAGLVGMATKFFTCTLACLYRKQDADGIAQGGPMYFIEVGLGPRFKPLAAMFAACGMIGCLGLFQINQIALALASQPRVPRAVTGVGAMLLVGGVILGGIRRVGAVTSRLVPGMGLLYVGIAGAVILRHAAEVPAVIGEIICSAFAGGAALGAATGIGVKEALITGVKRAAFSNEAGIGTAAMAHGAAKTGEPVREGLVAMLGPFIDTNIICTLTALVILLSGVGGGQGGVALTASAFDAALPGIGGGVLTLVVLMFGLSTLISYSYYTQKCAKYLFGEALGAKYVYIYLITLPIGALWPQETVINIMDTAFALMAIPTLTGALLLSPRVVAATSDYFARMGSEARRPRPRAEPG
jgi:alanine or glycine:cation symporter, AGCS family